MILLGLILIVVAVGIGTLLVLATQPLTEPVALEAAGVQVNVLPLVLLIAGAAVLFLLWLGLVTIRGSVRRKARRRREAKEMQRQAELDAQAREDEEARREAAERREAEARAAAAPVPAQRFATSRPGSDEDWAESGTRLHRDTSSETAVMESAPAVAADDRSAGRHAADVDVDSGPDADRSSDAGSAQQHESPQTTAVTRDATAPEGRSDRARTMADRIMGRDTHDTTDTTDTRTDAPRRD